MNDSPPILNPAIESKASYLRKLAERTRAQNEIKIVDNIIWALMEQCESAARNGYFNCFCEFSPKIEAYNLIAVKEAILKRLEPFGFQTNKVQILNTPALMYCIDVTW